MVPSPSSLKQYGESLCLTVEPVDEEYEGPRGSVVPFCRWCNTCVDHGDTLCSRCIICRNCAGECHWAGMCKKKAVSQAVIDEVLRIKCNRCQARGHRGANCPTPCVPPVAVRVSSLGRPGKSAPVQAAAEAVEKSAEAAELVKPEAVVPVKPVRVRAAVKVAGKPAEAGGPVKPKAVASASVRRRPPEGTSPEELASVPVAGVKRARQKSLEPPGRERGDAKRQKKQKELEARRAARPEQDVQEESLANGPMVPGEGGIVLPGTSVHEVDVPESWEMLEKNSDGSGGVPQVGDAGSKGGGAAMDPILPMKHVDSCRSPSALDRTELSVASVATKLRKASVRSSGRGAEAPWAGQAV